METEGASEGRIGCVTWARLAVDAVSDPLKPGHDVVLQHYVGTLADLVRRRTQHKKHTHTMLH